MCRLRRQPCSGLWAEGCRFPGELSRPGPGCQVHTDPPVKGRVGGEDLVSNNSVDQLVLQLRQNKAQGWTWSSSPSARLVQEPSQSVQSLSRVRLLETPWTTAGQASLSFTNSQSLLKLMSIEPMMPSNHLILCHPLLLPPSIFPSIRVFSNKSVLRIRWPKYWSFSFSPSNEYSGLISFRIDQCDRLAAQGTVQESSLTPQFESINSLVLSFLYSSTLTSIHDYWKKHSFG